MKKKRIYSVLISVLMIVILSVTTVAASNLTAIKAYLNHDIKLTLNGKPWTPPQAPITYNGSTYLPVRAVGDAVGAKIGWNSTTQTVSIESAGSAAATEKYDAILEFPADRFPETAAHIASAILAGESSVCTIDRAGADANRDKSLASIPTRDGYDRDEWPMAMCAEGGSGASVVYIDPSDNRGAGSWVGNQLEEYQDGIRVKFVVTFGDRDADAQRKTPTVEQPAAGQVYYKSCAEAKAVGAAPIREGDPGYGRHLDRDGDGIACES